MIYLSFWLAFRLRFFYAPFLEFLPILKGVPSWIFYQDALRVVVPLWIFVFIFWGKLYKKHFFDAADEFIAILKGVILSTLLMITATFLYRGYEYSRVVMGMTFFVSIFLLFLSREFWKLVLGFILEQLVSHETAMILGEGKSIEAMVHYAQKDLHRKCVHIASQNLEQAKKIVAEDSSLEEVIISGQLLSHPEIQNLLDECEDKEIEIKILPDLLEMRLGEIMVDDSLGLPILHLKPLSLHGMRFLFKRMFDVVLSILILSLFFFPLLIVSIWILLDSKGEIFFVQERVGFKEKRFKCVKFRTMHKNAEQLLEEMKLPSFRGGPAFKMKGDPRITRIGKWLRKFSMDELPQIWNILRGEMSFIGPRPQVIAEADGNPDWAKKRFRILPGITGLWQVSGRADLTYEDMMRLDIYYLENWSPGLDLKIVLKTIPVVLSSKGAY